MWTRLNVKIFLQCCRVMNRRDKGYQTFPNLLWLIKNFRGIMRIICLYKSSKNSIWDVIWRILEGEEKIFAIFLKNEYCIKRNSGCLVLMKSIHSLIPIFSQFSLQAKYSLHICHFRRKRSLIFPRFSESKTKKLSDYR